MDDKFLYFKSELEKLSISLDDHQYQQFDDYYNMLIEKNKVMNLTAITEFDDVIRKHFLDSLNLVRSLDLIKDGNHMKIIDMGTGAGFPGIPLKIAFPEINITLADSLNKRIIFLQEVIQMLGLDKIEAVHGRAEDLAKDNNYREQYDVCVSRAVANLSTLSEYCLPFVKINGKFIAYKSGDWKEELEQAKSAIFLLGGKKGSIETFGIDGGSRSLITIDKVHGTPKQYPRKSGMPSKKPL